MKKILIFLLVTVAVQSAPVSALADNFSISNTINTNATGTSTQVLGLNPFRNYLVIQNIGTAPVYVKMGGAHSGTEGVMIPFSGNWEPPVAPRDSIFVKSASGTQAIKIIEGNRVN